MDCGVNGYQVDLVVDQFSSSTREFFSLCRLRGWHWWSPVSIIFRSDCTHNQYISVITEPYLLLEKMMDWCVLISSCLYIYSNFDFPDIGFSVHSPSTFPFIFFTLIPLVCALSASPSDYFSIRQTFFCLHTLPLCLFLCIFIFISISYIAVSHLGIQGLSSHFTHPFLLGSPARCASYCSLCEPTYDLGSPASFCQSDCSHPYSIGKKIGLLSNNYCPSLYTKNKKASIAHAQAFRHKPKLLKLQDICAFSCRNSIVNWTLLGNDEKISSWPLWLLIQRVEGKLAESIGFKTIS